VLAGASVGTVRAMLTGIGVGLTSAVLTGASVGTVRAMLTGIGVGLTSAALTGASVGTARAVLTGIGVGLTRAVLTGASVGTARAVLTGTGFNPIRLRNCLLFIPSCPSTLSGVEGGCHRASAGSIRMEWGISAVISEQCPAGFTAGEALGRGGNKLVIAGEKTGFIERTGKPAEIWLFEFATNLGAIDKLAERILAERFKSAATGTDKPLVLAGNVLAGCATSALKLNGRAKEQSPGTCDGEGVFRILAGGLSACAGTTGVADSLGKAAGAGIVAGSGELVRTDLRSGTSFVIQGRYSGVSK